MSEVKSLGMALRRAPHRLYLQQVSSDDISGSLSTAITNLNQPQWVTGYSSSGTYAFRTAEGKAGVLRINWPSSGKPPKCFVQCRYLLDLDIPIDKHPWASAVEGVQCRLRIQKPSWDVHEVPTLSLDLRNRGEKTIDFVRIAEAHCEVEINGKWYGWAEPLIINAPVWSLEPQTELSDAIKIDLTDSWALSKEGNELKHRPGIEEFWVNT